MKTLLTNIKVFFANIRGFFEGWYQLNISQRDVIFSFYGFKHFDFAKKYADKRQRRNGYMHWVVPAGKGAEQLVVFNTLEKKMLKRRGMMSKKLTIYDMLKSAYYVTPITNVRKKK
jgi:hypothetical protein